jgi:spore maturation protein SpmA
MLNALWLGLILLAVLIGGFAGRMKAVVDGAVDGAQSAVTLALGLVGLMAVWLGLMRLAEKAGLVQALARALRPLLRWLFPDVPDGHPAMGSIVMNLAANMLGLTNAATPLGLRAMKDLESLNRLPGTATNAMCTFLAINTSSVQLIPMSAIAILAAAGSTHPTAIVGTALVATACSTAAGIVAVKTLEKLRAVRLPATGTGAHQPAAMADEPGFDALIPDRSRPGSSGGPGESEGLQAEPVARLPVWGRLVLVLFTGCFVWFLLRLTFPEALGGEMPAGAEARGLFVRAVNAVALLAIPFLVAFFPLYAWLRRIPVYEEFVEGAKEGFQVGVRIIPFLVTMLVAVGMFQAAGGVDLLTRQLRPVLDGLGFPSELLPMALMRPLSGSGSLAVFSDMVGRFGPDSLIVRMAGTLFGSTETTFYVVAVYFGAVGVKRTRHAVPAGLIADAVGIVASVIVCRLVLG